MPDWLTCDELMEGQMPPPKNHVVVNRDVLMEVISSLKVGKKQLQQWLYFVQFVISRLSSRNDGRVIRHMQIAQNLEEAIPGHHLTKRRHGGQTLLLPVHYRLR